MIVKSYKTVTWKKKIMVVMIFQKKMFLVNWQETSSFERNIPPYEILELVLTDEEMERICSESTNYARLKDEHNFTMTPDKL